MSKLNLKFKTLILLLVSNIFKTYAINDITSTPPTTTRPTTTPTKLPCYSRLTCFQNSVLNLSTCQCDCLPGYFFDYSSYRCIPIPTSTPTPTTRPCNLDCRAGSLVIFNGICQCICIEFYVFNGTSCYLASYYPRVDSCDECANIQSPFNRPMRCVQNIYDKFCVP